MDFTLDKPEAIDFAESKERITAFIKSSLKESRLKHTYSVAEEAVKLAGIHGADKNKAELAALFHDMCRNLPENISDMYVRQYGLPERYVGNKNLAHSKIAAEMMRRDYGIADDDLLNAVSFHTTGRAGMSVLEKIVFIADAAEPGRNYPGADELRRIAYEDLDKACIRSLENTIRYIEGLGGYLDPDTVEARDYLKEKISL